MTHARYAVLKTIVMALMLNLALSGCATDYRAVPAYQSAQAAYDQAKAKPGVSENASVAMYEASKYLDKARKAEEEKNIVTYSKLAEDQVSHAVNVAEKKMAEKKITDLKEQKQKIRLEARQREVEAAHKKTLLMKQEAEAKALEAKEALQKAEEAQKKG